MLVVGLTGGIGSGKSTVAKLFHERGITVIDADQLARDVTQKDQPALNSIKKEFGNEVLNSDGNLNRAALRKIIFQDDKKRIWLEKLLHPLIRAELVRQTQNAASLYCIVVIPLLLETKPNPLINRILIVDTAESEQIKRTQARDNATHDEVNAILKTQVTRTERLKAADDVITNDGSLADLTLEVDKLHNFYSILAKKKSFK